MRKINITGRYDPRSFLSARRIDLAAKTLFARAYLEDNKSAWPEEIYKEHLRAWNGFYEADPLKQSYQDFKDAFLRTLEATKADWHNMKPIDIYKELNELENGSHRAAAAIVANKRIKAKKTQVKAKYDWDYKFFSGEVRYYDTHKVLSEKYLDAMTIEYVSHKKRNIFVAVIYPAAKGHREDAYNHFRKLGDIVNMKSIPKEKISSIEVIRQLYYDEDWVADNNSVRHKAGACFDGNENLQIYVIETNSSINKIQNEKQYLRSLWGIDKHSIHITDTTAEANRLVRTFFHENTREFLKTERSRDMSRHLRGLFDEFRRILPHDPIERDNFCIDGASILDLYDLRDANDLDYIVRGQAKLVDSCDGIDCHNNTAKYHSKNIDELITNPNNFIYYAGIKFMTLENILQFKKNRYKSKSDGKDVKDKDDIKNIESYQKAATKESMVVELTTPPLFSICVPMYGVEKYVGQAIQDIKDQTYSNFECIIVNDKTPDNSVKIAQNIIGEDSRFKIINHKRNKGLPASRQTALDVAIGERVIFLDSDDRFDSALLENVARTIRSHKKSIDIVTWDFGFVDDNDRYDMSDHGWYDKTIIPKDVYAPLDVANRLFNINANNVWTKCFRRQFLIENNLVFSPDIIMGEDLLYSHCALAVAKSIYFLDKKMVFYRQTASGSISNNMDFSQRIEDVMAAVSELEKFLVQKELYETFKESYLRRATDDISVQASSAMRNMEHDYDLKLSYAQNELCAIYNSKSWKMTKPLRSINERIANRLAIFKKQK